MPHEQARVELGSFRKEGDKNNDFQYETLSNCSSTHKLLTESLLASSSSESLETSVFTDEDNEVINIAHGVGNMNLKEIKKEDMIKETATVVSKGKRKLKKRTKFHDLPAAKRLNFDIEEKEEDVEREPRIRQPEREQEKRDKTERDFGLEEGIVSKWPL